VHCSNGAARTGTYCLIDIVTNRITKGVKEMNVAGTLEHLRDQRMGMVGNLEQYKLVFTCVAEEVNVLLKNLQQQQQ
jgi:receptor-type tyrosine-protein phosphatase N